MKMSLETVSFETVFLFIEVYIISIIHIKELK